MQVNMHKPYTYGEDISSSDIETHFGTCCGRFSHQAWEAANTLMEHFTLCAIDTFRVHVPQQWVTARAVWDPHYAGSGMHDI